VNTFWKTTERYAVGKTKEIDKCEDLIVETGRFFGVIDSSSGFSPPESNISFGRMIGLEALAAFEEATNSCEMNDLISDATKRIKNLKQKRKHESKGTGGCFFCVFDARDEIIYRLGDCWYSLGESVNKFSLPVELPLTEIRSAYLNACLIGGTSVEELMLATPENRIILEYLKVKDNYANNTMNSRGYGVLNGDDVPDSFLEKTKVDSSVHRICIGTDGYPIAGTSLSFVEDKLSELLKHDPLLIHSFPAPKGMTAGSASFDDRGFIRIEKRREKRRGHPQFSPQ
jgi:hypothetical protein